MGYFIIYIGSVSSFVKFKGQTSMTFERFTLKRPCVCKHVSSSFMLFVLDEIHVRGDILTYEHVWVGSVQVNIPKDHPRVLVEGPFMVPKTVQDNPTNSWPLTASGSVDALLVGSH